MSEQDSWLRLAQEQRAAGWPGRALAACERGLAAAPASRDLIRIKAEILHDLGRLPEAGELYGRLPDDPQAIFGLARLALDGGDWTAAEVQLARLAAWRGSPQIHWLNGRIALGRGAAAEAAAAFQALATSPGLTPGQQAEGLLLLGQALDSLGEPAAAFEAARRGKAIQRRSNAAVAAGREPIGARLRRLRAELEPQGPDNWCFAPGARGPALGHVFLVGFPRSGTTLLEQALAGCSAIAALEEAPTLANAHAAFLTRDGGLRRLAELDDVGADALRADYWKVVADHGVDVAGRVFVDKAPAATEDLSLVARLFPEAKVLFAVRDPRDVILSCFRQDFRMNAMTYAFTDLAATADCYDANMALAEAYRRALPLPILDLRHEDLVADFEPMLRTVCDFIGVAFEPAMLDVGATARDRTVRTPSAPQVRAGLNTGGLGRWRAYADQLAPVLPVLAPWVARFGYPET